jgi:hypothetical protein
VERLAESQEPRLVARRVPAGAARREGTEGGHRGALQRHPATRLVKAMRRSRTRHRVATEWVSDRTSLERNWLFEVLV